MVELPRRWLLGAAAGLCAAGLLAPAVAFAQGGAGQVDKLVETLRTARGWKVRLQAATVLSKLHDQRVLPALGRAGVSDKHPTVRIMALRLLGKAPGGEPTAQQVEAARAQVRRGLQDRRSDVRAQANRSLAELDRRRIAAERLARRPEQRGPVAVAVGSMGDRSRRAGAALQAHMRAALMRQLRGLPTVEVFDGVQPRVSYIIDGTIARLEQGPSGPDMEILCAVQLVVSRPPRGIVMVVSGEASVLKPRSHFRASTAAAMQSEAVEHAVASAHDNLARFLKAAAH